MPSSLDSSHLRYRRGVRWAWSGVALSCVAVFAIFAEMSRDVNTTYASISIGPTHCALSPRELALQFRDSGAEYIDDQYPTRFLVSCRELDLAPGSRSIEEIDILISITGYYRGASFSSDFNKYGCSFIESHVKKARTPVAQDFVFGSSGEINSRDDMCLAVRTTNLRRIYALYFVANNHLVMVNLLERSRGVSPISQIIGNPSNYIKFNIAPIAGDGVSLNTHSAEINLAVNQKIGIIYRVMIYICVTLMLFWVGAKIGRLLKGFSR